MLTQHSGRRHRSGLSTRNSTEDVNFEWGLRTKENFPEAKRGGIPGRVKDMTKVCKCGKTMACRVGKEYTIKSGRR